MGGTSDRVVYEAQGEARAPQREGVVATPFHRPGLPCTLTAWLTHLTSCSTGQ